MRDKLVLIKNAEGLNVFNLPAVRNQVLSKKVAEILTYGMLQGNTESEVLKKVWDDESLSNEEVASLIFSLTAAIAKLTELSSKVGVSLKKPLQTVKPL